MREGLKLLFAFANLILKAIQEKRSNDVKNDPLGAFDGKFGSVHNDKPTVQQANIEPDSERELPHSEQSSSWRSN